MCLSLLFVLSYIYIFSEVSLLVTLSYSQLQQINLHASRFVLDLFLQMYTMSVILEAVPRGE